MFVLTSINDPDVEEILSWVSTMLQSQMEEDASKEAKHTTILAAFEEEKNGSKTLLPDVQTVYHFFKDLFDRGHVPCECGVVLLIYVNRLIGLTNVAIRPSNWKPLSLTALVLAQKIWDDDYLNNSDFALLYPILTTVQINFLERAFMQAIDFKLGVSQQLYAQYYFELRSLVHTTRKQPDTLLRAFNRLLPSERLVVCSQPSHTQLLTDQYYRNRAMAAKKRSLTLEDILLKPPPSPLILPL